jgi:ADP-heptose:LPS heptosyltransferase
MAVSNAGLLGPGRPAGLQQTDVRSAGPRLLVLRSLGLGDLLTAVPAYRGLRRAFGGHWLVLATRPALAPLALLTGAVDEVLPYTAPAPAPDMRWPPLRWPGSPPDLAVNLHGRGPQSHQVLVGLRPRRLWGFAHSSFPEVGGSAWAEDQHEVARWCDLLGQHGIRCDPEDLALPHPPGRASPRPGAVLVHPGAAAGARRWPADRFAAVAAELRRAGHPVTVTGGVAERGLAVAVAERAGLGRDDVLAGRTDVLDLAALVAGARLVVCGDTGLGHLATAYGTPSVLLFGPTPPARWGPPPDRRQHAVLWHGTGPADPTGDRPSPALLSVSVDEVLAAAGALLDGAAPARAQAADHPAGAPPGPAPPRPEPPRADPPRTDLPRPAPAAAPLPAAVRYGAAVGTLPAVAATGPADAG